MSFQNIAGNQYLLARYPEYGTASGEAMATAERYPIMGDGTANGAANAVDFLFPAAAKITQVVYYLSSNSATGTSNLALVQNGSSVAATQVSISGGAAGRYNTGAISVTVAAGDLFRMVPTIGAGAASIDSMQITYIWT